MSKDYERGVERATAVYKEIIREYVAENAELRKLVGDMMIRSSEKWDDMNELEQAMWDTGIARRAEQLGIETG